MGPSNYFVILRDAREVLYYLLFNFDADNDREADDCKSATKKGGGHFVVSFLSFWQLKILQDDSLENSSWL